MGDLGHSMEAYISDAKDTNPYQCNRITSPKSRNEREDRERIIKKEYSPDTARRQSFPHTSNTSTNRYEGLFQMS